VVFDSLSSGHREFVRWGKLIEGDIRNAAALEVAFSSHKIDARMHFAAVAYVGEAVVVPSDYYDVNVHGARVLLDAPAVQVFGSDYRTRDGTAIRDYVHVSDLARALGLVGGARGDSLAIGDDRMSRSGLPVSA